jgi:hypothetical protein
MAQEDVRTVLTFDLRGLVWGIESEVAIISALSGRIDDRVQALNAARREVAARLEQLDALLAAAEDPRLRAWLEPLVDAPLPTAAETFPERLYGTPGPAKD